MENMDSQWLEDLWESITERNGGFNLENVGKLWKNNLSMEV